MCHFYINCHISVNVTNVFVFETNHVTLIKHSHNNNKTIILHYVDKFYFYFYLFSN